jgi:hypothetical protein
MAARQGSGATRTRRTVKARFWIPPIPLAAGMGFQSLAWCLVLLHAVRPSFGVELAWIHAVALGWLTLTALAVLLHVIPGFTDLVWRAEGLARGAVVAVAAGSLVLVISFAAGASRGVAVSGAVVAAAIILYAVPAVWTLSATAPDRRSATIARGLALTVGALAATAILGAALAGAYAVANPIVLSAAPSHAVIGIVGWLTVLAAGVSSRTFRPLLGQQSRRPRAHALAGAGLLVGSVVAATAAPWSAPLLRVGIVLAAAGALTFAADAADILRRSKGPQAAARAFVTASVVWLILATALAVFASWGVPVGRAAVVVALAGWLGQIVNAHLHHLGVRVVATYIIGEDDETRPWMLLEPRLSWLAFAAAQLAVGSVALRAQGAPAAFAWLGGGTGLVSVIATAVNAVVVVRRARRLHATRYIADGWHQ